MNENLETQLLKGNLKFRWQVIQDLEKIDVREKFPKYPVLFLTCMDPRIDIHKIFQLDPSDVFVLRNAGNILTIDMLRSILIATHEYDIKHIIILGHLDCGMTKINLLELRKKLNSKSREFIIRDRNNQLSELRNFFKPFKDVLKNINEQIKTLKDFKGFASDIKIIGWLYDVNTGLVFETNNLNKYECIEDFMKNYSDIITKKDLELVDYLDSFEEEIRESKKLIPEKEIPAVNIESLKGKQKSDVYGTDFKNHVKQFNKQNIGESFSISAPRLISTKIFVPKIKVNVPNVYKRKRQENKI